uniref:Killer cell lectin-like receptor subfamily A n=1 Tax=Camelus dromedarius TaxID=9838 RepID=A0A516TYL3_CAMDR|nr:killer cell lectin-like receptor subfamily A [Camelus dromedarius]
MSDQEVTYSTVRILQPPSQSQNRLRPCGAEIARKTDGKESSMCWPRFAVILGIFCLFLLMAVIVLGTKIFQYIQEKHHQEEILRNLSQKYDILQNDSYSVRQLLTNRTAECGILKMKLCGETLWAYSTEKMECCRKKEMSSKCLQNTGQLKKVHWCCWGIKCYYFTTEIGDWKGCKQICQSYSSSLLKIDFAEELTFLRSQMSQNSYWIGLSFNKEESKWKWIDGDTCGFNLKVMNFPSGIGNCVFLTRTRTSDIACSNISHCICEKRIDCFNKC